MGKSGSPTNFRCRWRFLSSKETKSSLVSITYIVIIINVCQDNVKHGKKCTDEWFYFLCGVITVGESMLRHFTKKCMESRPSKLFIERCIRLNSYAKAVQLLLLFFFFWSAYITLLSTTGYKVLYGIYLAAQQQRKLIQFLVCSNVGVLSSLEIPPQAWEKHIYKLDFLSLAILVLEYYTARISMYRVLSSWLRQSKGCDFSSLFWSAGFISDFNRLFELLGPVFAPHSSNAFYVLE